MSVVMSAEPLVLRDRHWTVDDFDDLPHGDGNRYEIIDGALVVTGAPVMRHQRAVKRLAILLDAACPPEYEVFVAPFAVVLANDTVMQPDVLDLNMKHGRFARAGTPSYWVVGPAVDPAQAELIAWELTEGGYDEVAKVSGDEEFSAAAPYPVRVVPAALVR
jgi:putative restriction endonuclease